MAAFLSRSSTGAWLNYGIPATVFTSALAARGLSRAAGCQYAARGGLAGGAGLAGRSGVEPLRGRRSDRRHRGERAVAGRSMSTWKRPRSSISSPTARASTGSTGGSSWSTTTGCIRYSSRSALAEPRWRWLGRALFTGPVRAVVATTEGPLIEGTKINLRLLGYRADSKLGALLRTGSASDPLEIVPQPPFLPGPGRCYNRQDLMEESTSRPRKAHLDPSGRPEGEVVPTVKRTQRRPAAVADRLARRWAWSLASAHSARAQLTTQEEERLRILSDPDAIKKKMDEKKDRPPFEFFKSQVAPFDVLPYIKANHWSTLTLEMRANEADYDGFLQTDPVRSAADAAGYGLPPRGPAGEGAAAGAGPAGDPDAHPQGMDAVPGAAGRAPRPTRAGRRSSPRWSPTSRWSWCSARSPRRSSRPGAGCRR